MTKQDRWHVEFKLYRGRKLRFFSCNAMDRYGVLFQFDEWLAREFPGKSRTIVSICELVNGRYIRRDGTTVEKQS